VISFAGREALCPQLRHRNGLHALGNARREGLVRRLILTSQSRVETEGCCSSRGESLTNTKRKRLAHRESQVIDSQRRILDKDEIAVFRPLHVER
ncbi:hypothetical protein PFISCL1PPCAC_11152, partial [Pristionchus fissidentatus]